MYEVFDTVPLKDGTPMEIGVVVAPDAAHAEEIPPFLSHKPGFYGEHIRRSIVEPLGRLETRFYVGKVEGRIVTNIMLTEHLGCGIVGHVYTSPSHRRRGACSAVMARQMEDFRARGGRVLHLNTGFDTPPYHIYKRHGFESVFPRTGFMSYFAKPDFEATAFVPRPAHVRDVRWEDWGHVIILTGRVGGDWLRSVLWKMEGPSNFEGDFLAFRHQAEKGEIRAGVLVTEDETRVGVATLAPHPIWSRVHLLDLLVHPNFWSEAGKLIAALEPFGRRTVAYADECSEGKVATLEAAGFRVEGRLRRTVRRTLRPDWRPDPATGVMYDDSAFETTDLDVLVLARNE